MLTMISGDAPASLASPVPRPLEIIIICMIIPEGTEFQILC